MSNYTTELRFLIAAGVDLGLDKYPIFDESYRPVLNQKIIDHFLFREIGMTPVARFKHYLNMTLNEQMPVFNQLYLSQLLTFNPLHDTNLSEDSTKTGSGSSTSNSTTNSTSSQTSDNLSVESDTPQGMLSVGNIKNNTYASHATMTDDQSAATGHGTQTATASGSSLDDYIKTVTGNSGTKNFSELLSDFRATFINIDLQVIDALESCFMGVY